MASNKKRLDVLLVERGLVESRQRAQAIIMSGQVYVGEQKVDKAGVQLPEDADIQVRGQLVGQFVYDFGHGFVEPNGSALGCLLQLGQMFLRQSGQCRENHLGRGHGRVEILGADARIGLDGNGLEPFQCVEQSAEQIADVLVFGIQCHGKNLLDAFFCSGVGRVIGLCDRCLGL